VLLFATLIIFSSRLYQIPFADGGSGVISRDYSSNPQFLLNLTPAVPTDVNFLVNANFINTPFSVANLSNEFSFTVRQCGV